MVTTPYCTDADVRTLSPFKKSEINETEMQNIIVAAISYIDKGLATMYDVPFDDVVVHPLGIPEQIRWLTAEKSKCLCHHKLFDDQEPNETDAGKNCNDSIDEQLQRLRDCDDGLTYPDGSEVPRTGNCPDDSPGPGNNQTVVKSNTQNDPYVFDLQDIKDLDDYESFAWD